ncbi:carbohydrate ABC transporter membrane protein 2, CUT1 family [Halovenus aranensis]|jgi:multiple sugar transport system permease protein|uniref:Carbohydrate ABC transporter membrane protein 2, CUT1 family n=1 Tax=Halovenus aranensis TaxID=890420 RepID=A0A1G8S5N3_9EURY|nr:carbohydrate ABC transporter permease [Halovenus aranensis]SDJ24529.1 carbohydrate ABC transporter membrane protein 2, CUT1 family [Halovenus aranensis]
MAGRTDTTFGGARLDVSWSQIRRYCYDGVTYLVYGLAVLFFLFPVLWVISLSLRTEGAVYTSLELLPSNPSLDSYREVLDSGLLRWMRNTLFVAVLSVTGILLVTTPAAYGFSRFRFRGRRSLLLAVLGFQMISPIVIVLPLYDIMRTLGLTESHTGLILLYIGLQIPFSLWLLKGYFDTIPTELDKAARIDGCNRLQTLRYVLLRPVMPGIAVVAIFNFVLTWSEFVMAYTMLSPGGEDLYTLSMGIYVFDNQLATQWTNIAAAAVIGIVPIVIFFVALQRYFVRGLTDGAVKG